MTGSLGQFGFPLEGVGQVLGQVFLRGTTLSLSTESSPSARWVGRASPVVTRVGCELRRMGNASFGIACSGGSSLVTVPPSGEFLESLCP